MEGPCSALEFISENDNYNQRDELFDKNSEIEDPITALEIITTNLEVTDDIPS